jgi:hypothetical protein
MLITADKLLDKHYNYKKAKTRIDHHIDRLELTVCNFCERVRRLSETVYEYDLCVCDACSHADES